MRKIICYILIITVAFIFPSMSAFAVTEQPILTVSCSNTVASGDTITVNFDLSANSNAAGGSFNVCYDNALLEVKSATVGSLITGNFSTINSAYAENKVRITWAGTNVVTEQGCVLSITFKANTVYENTPVNISIEKFKLADANSTSISCSSQNGLLNILAKEKPSIFIDSPSEALMGGKYEVQVRISENSLANGGSFNLVYDNSKFILDTSTSGTMLSGNYITINNTYASNKIRMNWAGTNEISVSGILVTFVFNVKSDAVGTSEFIIENPKLADVNSNTIACTSANSTTTLVTELRCCTKTTFSESAEKIIFNSTVTACPNDAVLIVALYSGNMLSDIKFQQLNSNANITTEFAKQNFETAKVMVWNSMEIMMPLSDAEEINYK